MKISIDINCSPEEARTFLGMPDLKPMQDAFIEKLQERLIDGMAGADFETLLKAWMPTGLKDLGEMQKAFWSHVMGGAKPGPKDKP